MTKKIGILYSPGYGGGWSSWGNPKMALDQELALAVANEAPIEELERIALKNWPDDYVGGVEDLHVHWVDEGTVFRITEYDGAEDIEYPTENYWKEAK